MIMPVKFWSVDLISSNSGFLSEISSISPSGSPVVEVKPSFRVAS